MKATRCPYLGMADDPDTRLDFPSPGNVCHKASPPGPIKLDYQQSTCLTGQHTGCPVFTAVKPIPVPANILAHTPSTAITRRIPLAGRLPAAVVLLALFGILLFALLNGPGTSGQNSSTGGNNGDGSDPSGMFWLPRTGENSRTTTPNPTDMQFRTTCPPPNGWVTYTVNPTDSLYRLSVVHSISVEDLQRANCLGNETVILPGQVIYLPFTPTLTPSATPTPTRFIAVISPTPEADDDEDAPAPQNTATAAPPTPAPPTVGPTRAPTRAPTTAVPPTRAPTTAVPTTQAPTTAVPPTEEPTQGVPTSIIPPIIETLLPPLFPTDGPTETPGPPESDG